jgi:hypothetical protein
MIGWPSVSLIFGASMRITVSMPPPAGNGTMARIGRVGYDWA